MRWMIVKKAVHNQTKKQFHKQYKYLIKNNMNIENVIFQTLHTLSETEFSVIKAEYNNDAIDTIILQLSEKANRDYAPEELTEARTELGGYLQLSDFERTIEV